MSHPRALTDATVNHRVAKVESQRVTRALVEELSSRENSRRSMPTLCGKASGFLPRPVAYHDEAYGTLLETCGPSEVGRRVSFW